MPACLRNSSPPGGRRLVLKVRENGAGWLAFFRDLVARPQALGTTTEEVTAE